MERSERVGWVGVGEWEVKSYQPSALGSSGQRKFKERKVRIKKNLTQKATPEEVEYFKNMLLIKNQRNQH